MAIKRGNLTKALSHLIKFNTHFQKKGNKTKSCIKTIHLTEAYLPRVWPSKNLRTQRATSTDQNMVKSDTPFSKKT